MISKLAEREEAIRLRREGMSLREILKNVPVAKSTLSLWLRKIEISKAQKQVLTEKKLAACKRGGERRKLQRIEVTGNIKGAARAEISSISFQDLLLLGAALYWGEGNKLKSYRVSQNVRLGNSDPKLLKIYLLWLDKCCNVSYDELVYSLYIHENSDVFSAKQFWSRELNVPLERLNNVVLKKNKLATKRKNVDDAYHGLLSIMVRRSTNLNRRIEGWIEAIFDKCWGIV